MKVLIDPNLAILAKDLTDKEKAELLMCILEYPDRDCDLGLWKYIRQQIDVDARKYKEKCDRMLNIRYQRPVEKSQQISEVKKEVVVSKDNIIKDNCNSSESSNAKKIVENSVKNFFITETFSFQNISNENAQFKNYLNLYLIPVIERAEKTLIKKRINQWLSMSQIVEWIEQENHFYKQKQGDVL